MNEAMSLTNIVDYAKANELTIIDKSNFLWGVVEAKSWKYALFPIFSALSITHFLLIFTFETVTIVGLTKTGNFTESLVTIPTKEMEAFVFKKGLIQSKMTFRYESDTYTFKIPNMVAVANWQKLNLARLVDNKFYKLM